MRTQIRTFWNNGLYFLIFLQIICSTSFIIPVRTNFETGCLGSIKHTQMSLHVCHHIHNLINQTSLRTRSSNNFLCNKPFSVCLISTVTNLLVKNYTYKFKLRYDYSIWTKNGTPIYTVFYSGFLCLHYFLDNSFSMSGAISEVRK